MRRILVCSVLLASVPAAGCGPPGRALPGEDAVPERGLVAAVEARITPDVVRLVLHVTNASRGPIEFTFPTSQRYDFWVGEESGRTLWQWSRDMVFLQVITHATLAPGETWTFSAEWPQGDRTGRYVATGRLMASDRAIQQQVMFELP